MIWNLDPDQDRHSVGPDLSPVIFCGASALSVLSMEIYVGEQAI